MKTKKLAQSNKITAFLLALLLILAILPFRSGLYAVSGYSTNTFTDFQPVELGIENPQFSNYSGSLPATPSGWTETAYANKDKGSSAMGVLDLDNYNTEEVRSAAKLGEYPEYSSGVNDVPISPFGKRGVVAAKNGTDKILMVNTTKATSTVIGYQSSTVALNANKFFRISAWAKTGDFYGQYGAAVRLNGIPDRSIAFSNIRTAKSTTELTKENFYGWKQYTFYIKTSSVRSENVSLALTVGDYYRGNDETSGGEIIINQNASGYAFFGNVEAVEISPSVYNMATMYLDSDPDVYGDNIQFIDLSLNGADPKTGDALGAGVQTDDLSFVPVGGTGDVLKNYTISSAKGAGISVSDLVYPAILNTDLTFNTATNPFGLSDAPIHPTGKYSGDGYVLTLSSLRSKGTISNDYRATAVGYTSDAIQIQKFQYYRLSVWVNTQDISGGAGATLVVTTNREDRNNPDQTIRFTATGCEGNPANEARYGFSEYAFYIKGSIYQDYTITLGLWLGQEDNLTKGIAMFAEPKFEKLTADEFNTGSAGSAGGRPVDIDVLRAETGVPNGNFSSYVESNKDDELPSVSSWTAGQAYKQADTDKVIHGVMFTDEAHYQANRALYGDGAVRPVQESSSVLYVASTTKNAFSYSSPAFALEEATPYAINVTMRVDNVDGYGASLVLKDSYGTISTIENITSTSSRFHTYTFYVQGDGTARELTLEIWLGMLDREGTERKLSSGNLYVSEVGFAASDEATFATMQAQYKNALNSWVITKADYGVYDYSTMNFTEFDPNTNSFIKYPYLWSISGSSNASPITVRSGIFDSATIPYGVGDIPSYFHNQDARDASGNLYRNNVLMLSNGAATSSQLTLDRSYNLAAEMYYELTVSMKVDIKKNSDTAKGAGIQLTGTDFKFEDISSTVDPLDPSNTEKFKTFSFYIYTGSESRSFQLAFTLGGEKVSEFCSGYVYVNAVTFSEITNTHYNEETDKITRDTDNVVRAQFKNAATTNDTTEETPASTDTEPGRTNTDNWALIPSILFAGVMLFALGWIIVRRIGENLSARRVRRGAGAPVVVSDYDRKKATEKGFKDFVVTEGSEPIADEEQLYQEFDDNTAIETKQSEKEHKLAERKAIIETAVSETDEPTESVKPEPVEDDFLDSFDDELKG